MSAIESHSRDATSKAGWYALAVLLLTSIHHAYGAHIYATPWRYHAVLVAAVATLAMLAASAVQRSARSPIAARLARGVFVLATLGVGILAFGLYEGLYNHVAKNLFFFGGASTGLMTRLFPPPTYEMPNDLLFELTGVLQVVPAALSAWYLYRSVTPLQVAEPRLAPPLLQRGEPRTSGVEHENDQDPQQVVGGQGEAPAGRRRERIRA